MEDKKRMNAEERETLNLLFAIGSLMDVYGPVFQRMLQRTDNGWRDFRLAQSKLEKLLENVLRTIPIEQLKVIKRHMEMQGIHVGVRNVAQRPKDYWLMTYDDLADLAEYATKNNCFACDNPGSCRLREILKELPIKGVEKLIVHCWRD